ncbi:MAG: helicase-associated domain-containing protein [Candidatus Planktophila sp.]|nr:helicase-associated domain-containing protein [Candidatus Planktophila sp.]
MEMRSFSDYLRSIDDASFLELFTARPDLITPVPPDISSLSVRACSAPSLARAIDSLNQWQFQVLEAAGTLNEPFSVKSLVALTHKAATSALEHLIAIGLVYPSNDGMRLPSQLRDLIGNEPAGLGPSSMVKLKLADLDNAPADAKKVLERLIWGPPRGSVGDIKNPGPGVAWLLERKFLVPLDQRTVILPREVGLYLRGGKTHKEMFIAAPTLSGVKRDERQVNRAAIANISTVLRWVEELLNFWAEEPADALRAGGLGVRDLKIIATHLGLEESCTAFIVELAYLASLISIDPTNRIMPSNKFDIWLMQTPSDRWQAIASAWLITSRVSGLVGRAEAKNVAALGPELDRVNATRVRALTLSILTENESLSPDSKSFNELLAWRAPVRRNSSSQEELATWTLREAEWLGITGQGAISKYGVRFLNGDELDLINSDLPKTVDHILIQSDNTAIAPGPLEHEISQQLAIMAEIESRGGATVYRFSEATIRRALDHGKTGDEIRSFLKKTSKTPMPQPLEYLITDVAKKHGKLRVGNTSSFIRCEDTSLISQIMLDKKLDILSLRRIAPEVVVCDHDATELVRLLRESGYLPAVESANGLMLMGARANRALTKPRPPRVIGEIEIPSEDSLNSAIRAIRTGEKSTNKQTRLRQVANEALGALPRSTANETMDLVNRFIIEEKSLSIGYADNNGSVTHRIIDPIRVSAGSLIARDHATGEVQSFRIPRITGVAPI